MQAVVEAMLGLSLGPFRTEAATAQSVLEQCVKRYPAALAPTLLPPLLLALVGATVRFSPHRSGAHRSYCNPQPR